MRKYRLHSYESHYSLRRDPFLHLHVPMYLLYLLTYLPLTVCMCTDSVPLGASLTQKTRFQPSVANFEKYAFIII